MIKEELISTRESWANWMKDYSFGTMAFLPLGDSQKASEELRRRFDPTSAKISQPHVTITQPFAKAPSPSDLQRINEVIAHNNSFDIKIGPATTSPNQRLLWLDISNKNFILKVREELHSLGLFRLDLPLTKGFIPHLTISEAPREVLEVRSLIKDIDLSFKPWDMPFDTITWIVPDDEFIFRKSHVFKLGSNKKSDEAEK